jgi:membrane protease YdiL (CAAX protease family)
MRDSLYLKAALLLICMSPSALAAMISTRVRSLRFYEAYLLVLGTVALTWSVTEPVPFTIRLDWIAAAGLFFGALGGYICWHFDVWLSGKLVTFPAEQTSSIVTMAIRPSTDVGIGRLNKESRMRFELPSLLGIAILEEVIYRGILLGTAFDFGGKLSLILAIILQLVLFCLAHLAFGWAHVLTKAPLGILCTIFALSNSLQAAAAIHLAFNYSFWRAEQ